METIYIAENEGTAIPYHCDASGTDPYGAMWIPFAVDSFADQESGQCAICERDIESGYLCLDGGEEVCAEHVQIVPQWNRDILARDFTDSVEHINTLVAVRCDIGGTLIETGAKHAPNKYLGWTVPA